VAKHVRVTSRSTAKSEHAAVRHGSKAHIMHHPPKSTNPHRKMGNVYIGGIKNTNQTKWEDVDLTPMIKNEVSMVRNKTALYLSDLRTFDSAEEAMTKYHDKALAAAISVEEAKSENEIRQAFADHGEEVADSNAASTAVDTAAHDAYKTDQAETRANMISVRHALAIEETAHAQVLARLSRAGLKEAERLEAKGKVALAAANTTKGAKEAQTRIQAAQKVGDPGSSHALLGSFITFTTDMHSTFSLFRDRWRPLRKTI
jgi:hypothetical protein